MAAGRRTAAVRSGYMPPTQITFDQGRALLVGIVVNFAIIELSAPAYSAGGVLAREVDDDIVRGVVDKILARWHRDSLAELNPGETDRELMVERVMHWVRDRKLVQR